MTIFLTLSFLILYSLFFPTVVRAQLDCGAYGFEENGCCNYGDTNLNPYHITADDERCNSNWCEKRIFGGDFPYGDCNYCNPNVCVRKDGAGGCAGVCNNVCCATAPPDEEEEEENCHMEDENLITCCQVFEQPAPPSLLEALRGLIERAIQAIIPISLRVEDFQASEDFDKATDYYYGKTKTNGGSEEIDEGVFFRLAPPSLLEEELPTEEAKVEKRKEWAKWNIELDEGVEEDDSVNDGKLRHVEPYRYAVENLRNFLVAIPKTENSVSGYETPKEMLVYNSNPATTPPSSGKVLAATDPCTPPVEEAPTKKTCTPDDVRGASLLPNRLLDLIFGGLKLFPKIVDLDKIGHYTTGIETDPEGAAFRDPHYEDGGFLEIFRLPTEPPYEDRNAKGKAAGLTLVISPPNPFNPSQHFDIPIHIGARDLKIRHQGSDTYVRENIVWPKLTPPTTEDNTSGYKAPENYAIRLASTQNFPTHLPRTLHGAESFAERLGRTLGRWLGRLVTL